MSCGIYKITNKVNQKSYIGQSKNIERRWQQHLYEAKNSKQIQYTYTIHKAFQKYGIENFSFEILELTDKLDEREVYWINYFNTYNNGYNETTGGDKGPTLKGEKNPKAKLKNNDVNEIRNRLLKGETPGEVYEDYQSRISKSAFLKIWRGETWRDINQQAINYVKTEEYLHNMKSRAARIQHQKRKES